MLCTVGDVSTRINVSFYYIQEMSKKRVVVLKGDVQLKAQHSEVVLEFVERQKYSYIPHFHLSAQTSHLDNSYSCTGVFYTKAPRHVSICRMQM